MKNIIILLGTAREGRKSEKVAHFILSLAQKRNEAHFFLVDIANFPQNKSLALEEKNKIEWKNNLDKADALLIVAPEYNHSYPGELKMFLDNEYEAYKNKIVAICGVSSGPIGGARMIEQLKLVLNALEMRVIKSNIFFSFVDDIFLKNGEMKDEKMWKLRVNKLLDTLLASLD